MSPVKLGAIAVTMAIGIGVILALMATPAKGKASLTVRGEAVQFCDESEFATASSVLRVKGSKGGPTPEAAVEAAIDQIKLATPEARLAYPSVRSEGVNGEAFLDVPRSILCVVNARFVVEQDEGGFYVAESYICASEY